MELLCYSFDYEQGFEWVAAQTGSIIYRPAFGHPSQPAADKDKPRVHYFPHSHHQKHTGQYYFSGWSNLKPSFCYIQGDMDGGGFIQPFWNAFAINNFHNVEAMMQVGELRFGYVDDKNNRCSFALLFHLHDPSVWMVSMVKDANNASLRKRKVKLFISDFFGEELEDAEDVDQSDAWKMISKNLKSTALAEALKNIFVENGNINISEAKAFTAKHLKHWGAEHKAVLTREISPSPSIAMQLKSFLNKIITHLKESYYAKLTASAAVGAGLGWFIGAFVIGPVLAPFTMGFSLITAPYLFAFIGMCIGGAIYGRYVTEAPVIHQQFPRVEEPSDAPARITTRDDSYVRMHKNGLEQRLMEEKHARQALNPRVNKTGNVMLARETATVTAESTARAASRL